MTERVFIVGATSSIAIAVAHRFAARGARLHLAARDETELQRIASDLAIRHGAEVTWSVSDLSNRATHPALVDEAERQLRGLDKVVLAVGLMGDQTRAENDARHAESIIDANYIAPVSLLVRIAAKLEANRAGVIACLLSVAGDRGRRSNYVYGSAKAGLDVFLEGLRARLWRSGVAVCAVKLGFVDTRMTFGKSGLFLVATPARAAAGIVRAIDRRRAVTYVPAFWWPAMTAIRLMPRPIFHRLPL